MQFDLKKATVRIKDGATNVLTVKVGEGTLTYTEHRPIQYMRDRGLLDTTREGDQQPVDVKLDITWEFIMGDASDTRPITIEDALKQRGGASAWVSSDTADACSPYAVDIEVAFAPCATLKSEEILLPDFRYEELGHDAKTGVISVSGKCNVVQADASRHLAASSF